MKVYNYCSDIVRQATPKWYLHPLRRLEFSKNRGRGQAFLLSSKRRLYILRGEGVEDMTAAEMENVAFEKYAPLRGLKLFMLVRVHSWEMNRAKNLMAIDCDLLDYHERVMCRHQKLEIPRAYKGTKNLWRYIRSFDNEMINERRLQINETKTEMFEKREFVELKSRLSWGLFLNAVCFVMALFVSQMFYLVGVAVGIRTGFHFKEILDSPYPTDKKAAYMMVANIVISVLALALFIFL